MKTNDFYFDLPETLVAQFPPEQRGTSRLMVLNRGKGTRSHRTVAELCNILIENDFCGKNGGPPLLVFNNSKVRKARLSGVSQTGSPVEFLLLEQVTGGKPFTWKALAGRAKRRKTGSRYTFFDEAGTEIAAAEITGGEGEFRLITFDRNIDDSWLDLYGRVPLPPYIKRKDTTLDSGRYQCVYADSFGSAAAPTAGLHFTEEMLSALCAAGIGTAFVTLHVGPGTFLPVRSENIEDHVMHEEYFTIAETDAEKIERAKAEGRKIIAVGTTSVRTLESAWAEGRFTKREGRTSIFIYPGYQFKAVDALFTNFHTPGSTLLMLVSAFAGRDLIMESYAEAVKESYRFFSYGDAMLIF